MNNDLTEIWMILDRSGSMGSIHSGTVEAVNAFVKDQKKEPGEARFTLRQFDDEVITSYDRVALDQVTIMKLNDFEPRGTTALHDAIGQAILDLGRILEKTPEADRPGTVVFCIMTDGMENACREFSGQQVADMIQHQKSTYNWEFIFLGADIDVDAVADDLKVGASRHKFKKCKKSVREAMVYASDQVTLSRNKNKAGR